MHVHIVREEITSIEDIFSFPATDRFGALTVKMAGCDWRMIQLLSGAGTRGQHSAVSELERMASQAFNRSDQGKGRTITLVLV